MKRSAIQRSAENKMCKKGRIEIELFIVLITIVATSAAILLLVRSGTIEVKEEVATEPILNAEFLPMGREGFLTVKDFAFCGYINEDLNCADAREEFGKTEKVYVWFVVESSVTDGQVMLLRNYKMVNPLGEIVLQSEQQNAYTLELNSGRKTENVAFREFFLLGEEAEGGEYTLDVMVENPVLGKKVTLTKKFTLSEGALS